MRSVILVLILLSGGCSGAWKLNKEPIVLQDKSEITIVHAKSKNFFSLGKTFTGIYVFQFKDGECKLIRADSDGSASSAIESLKDSLKLLVP
jgi:hypothetical protein